MPAKDLWNGQRYYLVEGRNVEELQGTEAIRATTYAFTPIVSQTEIWNEETCLRAIIECPVKTLNTNRERDIYQVDTGPIVLPDLSQRYERHADGISLAFVAINAPHFADFVIEVPTQVGEGQAVCEIYNYSHSMTLPAKNRLYVVKA